MKLKNIAEAESAAQGSEVFPNEADPRRWSSRYRNYAILLLMVIYTINYIDRTIINTIAEPLKNELGLSDTQLGLLTGTAFGILYSVFGVVIGYVSDRVSRARVIALSLFAWSLMTCLCGLASSFALLLAARMGVAVGESGATPATQSIISDSYPRHRRATMLSVYSVGLYIGIVVGALIGGWIGQTFGWRMAFIAVGLPGLPLALLAFFTLREPVRGCFDDAKASGEAPDFLVCAKSMVRIPVVRWALIANVVSPIGVLGFNSFAIPFLMRGYQIDLVTAAFGFALAIGITGALGNLLGGVLADRLGMRRKFWYMGLPAIGYIVAAACMPLSLYQQNLVWMAVLAGFGSIGTAIAFSPVIAVVHGHVGQRMRGTASALMMAVMNLFGMGFGPLMVGSLSDFAVQWFHPATATFEGLRVAMALTTGVLYLLAASAYARAGAHLSRVD